MTLKAVHNHLSRFDRNALDSNETLIMSIDGFCWLRGVNGCSRYWFGRFKSITQAEEACRFAGFEPTAWCNQVR